MAMEGTEFIFSKSEKKIIKQKMATETTEMVRTTDINGRDSITGINNYGEEINAYDSLMRKVFDAYGRLIKSVGPSGAAKFCKEALNNYHETHKADRTSGKISLDVYLLGENADLVDKINKYLINREKTADDSNVSDDGLVEKVNDVYKR